jgi:hypothetical protein
MFAHIRRHITQRSMIQINLSMLPLPSLASRCAGIQIVAPLVMALHANCGHLRIHPRQLKAGRRAEAGDIRDTSQGRHLATRQTIKPFS